MHRAFGSWEAMQALECDTCKELRARRCRVRGFGGSDDRHAQPPFTEAPYVVPFNLPKYFAQQLRAMEFAKAAEPPKQLLWIVARDKPFLGDTTRLSAAQLDERKATWLRKHDMATAGIMGLMPIAQQMPVRFTATQSKS